MSLATPDHAVVVLPENVPLDADNVHALMGSHLTGSYTLASLYPVRKRRPRSEADLLQPQRAIDGTLWAAAGPLSRLDLRALAHHAYTAARSRWHAWRHLVGATTPQARDWPSYLAQRQHAPRALPLSEARRRFEAQPRVLTMLALTAARTLPFPLDIDELDAYQAGETVYCTLAWQQALVGKTLVVPGAPAYRPVTTSLADRLRYLQTALDVVHSRPQHHRLAALLLTH